MPMLSPTHLRPTARFPRINKNAKYLSTTTATELDMDYEGFVGYSNRGVTLWEEHTVVLKTGNMLSFHVPQFYTGRLTESVVSVPLYYKSALRF